MKPSIRSELLPLLAVAAAMVIFGSAGVFAKSLALPPAAMAFFRFAAPFFVTAITCPRLLHAAARKPDPLLLAASCLTAVRIYCWVLAFTYAPMVIAIVILDSWPLFLTLLSVVFLGDRPGRTLWTLLAMAFAGVVLIVNERVTHGNDRELLGLLLMGVVAVINALVLTPLRSRPPREVILYDNFVGTLVFSGFAGRALVGASHTDLAHGLIYGVLLGYISCRLLFFGYGRISSSVLSVLSYLEVLSATYFGILWFGEKVTATIAVGGGLTLAAVLSLTFLRQHLAPERAARSAEEIFVD